MVSKHDVFIPPKNEEQVIWRYLDFTKFVSMLDTKSLFFTRADRFEDEFEGSVPKKHALLRDVQLKEMVDKGLLNEEYRNDFFQIHNQNAKKEKGINCWHMNEHESAAMWKLYLKSNEGIAIKSTYKKLVNSLSTSPYNIFIGKVTYIDYDKDFFPFNNGFYPFVHKRKSFIHEKELRAIIWFEDGINSPLLHNLDLSYGLNIEVELDELIDSIYVSPTAPKWFYDLVKSIVEKYEINKELNQSRINETPIY